MTKSLVLFREIIVPYHPEFSKSKELQDYALRYPHIFNAERLVEESFAAVGPYTFIDAEHADFSDGSDSKTASIRLNAKVEGTYSHVGEISNVQTAGGGKKNGSLRCVIYNPHTDGLMYYFLPKEWWQLNITIHPSSNIGKIRFTYNRWHDKIPKFETYRRKDFVDLALAT